MNKFISFLGLVFLFSGKCSYAYEVDTHAEISDRAIDASRMSESLSPIGISIKDRLTPQAISLKK